MKNLQITTLLEPVPSHIRLDVYRESLYLIENNIKHKALFSHALCLLLPCVLWDLDSTNDLCDQESGFTFIDTPKAFTEFTRDILKDLNSTNIVTDTNKKRIFYLKKFIKELEQTETTNQPFYIKWYQYIKNLF